MSWMHYNPQRADAALLDRITFGESRVALRDALVDVVRTETDRKSHQHQLLIGARGAGKTHLLRVVAHRVATDPALMRSWRSVVLPEEQGIRGPSELFVALLTRLAVDLEGTDLAAAQAVCLEVKQAIGKARGETAMRLGFDGLKRTAAALDRKILAVVENLDALFYRGVGGGKKEADAELWGLRKYLQDADFLLLFGATPTYFGAASDYGAAFHGHFREHTLDALPLDEVLHIAEEHLALVASEGATTRAQRAGELRARFGEKRGRLAGMLRITGGLPRFAHLIVDLLIDSADADTEAQLERLLDEQTPYFQGRLDPRLIPPAELEALTILARASGPLRPSELARRAGISTAEIAVLLERLRERGLARRSGSFGGATAWDVAEPLYRVWMAFREGGEQRNVMVALSEVVAGLYSADELQSLAREASDGSDATSIWAMAIAHPVLANDQPAPGSEELAFQSAQQALTAGEPNGNVGADILIKFVDAAWRTGRRRLAAAYFDAMLDATTSDPKLRAVALLTAAQGMASPASARAAAAAAAFDNLGLHYQMLMAKGQEGQALTFAGHIPEAAILLAATYQSAVTREMPAQLLSWLALLTSHANTARDGQLEWLVRAQGHARVGSLDEANVLRRLADLAGTREERFERWGRAADTYRSLGMHAALGSCLVAQCDLLCAERKTGEAAEVLAKAVDLFIEHDADLGVPVWPRLRDFAVWGARPVAALALTQLAAGVHHEGLRATVEPWLLAAATGIIAAGSHSHEQVMELLVTVRDDLPRERRGMLEPFILAARMETEDHASILFEQSEPMGAVIADVRRSVDAARTKQIRPNWAVVPTSKSEPKSPKPRARKKR